MYLKSLRADRQHTDALHCLISLLSLRDTIVSGGIVECSSLVMSYGMAQEVATCNLDKFVLLKVSSNSGLILWLNLFSFSSLKLQYNSASCN